MPRRSQPWRRPDTKAWYGRIGGRKIWLGPPELTKTEAAEILDREIVATRAEKKERAKMGGLTFREVVNLFTIAVEGQVARGERKPLTLEGYDRFLVPAAGAFGKIPVAGLKPKHVQAWLDGQPTWNGTTRNNAITAVKACLNWAKKQGHVGENPVRDMDKPSANVTELDLPPDQAAKILDAINDRAFKNYLTVLWGTGMRPSEVMRVSASDLRPERGELVMDGKTTGATGRKRVVHLTPDVMTLLSRLAEIHPDGPLLRNTRGTPWTRHTTAHRFERLRKRLKMGKEATSKSFRHGYVTDALESGVPVATVAELVGHSSTKMVERHYSKLRERTEHLKEAARKVRPGEST